MISPFFHPPAALEEQFGNYRSLLRFANGHLVKDPQDWLARRTEIHDSWQKILGSWPELLERPQLELLNETQRDGLIQRHVRVQIAPHQSVLGYLLLPQAPGPFPGVIVPYYEPETSVGLGQQEFRDFGLQLARRGFVTLSIGSPGGDAWKPVTQGSTCQPLFFLAYVAANCHTALANFPNVDRNRIGIVGHSYGGKWALFGACFYEKFACGVWSDPGVVFDEKRPNVNYWEPWYLGKDALFERRPGLPTDTNPRTGAYRKLVEEGRDLHEVLALMAPRPFLVSGGSEDTPTRWEALNRVVEVNDLLGQTNRVAMTHRKDHTPTAESNAQIYAFLEHFLKIGGNR